MVRRVHKQLCSRKDGQTRDQNKSTRNSGAFLRTLLDQKRQHTAWQTANSPLKVLCYRVHVAFMSPDMLYEAS